MHNMLYLIISYFHLSKIENKNIKNNKNMEKKVTLWDCSTSIRDLKFQSKYTFTLNTCNKNFIVHNYPSEIEMSFIKKNL